jgi:hypothetical protein
MQHPMTFDVEYREHVRQMAWVNVNDWQFEKPAKRHPVRRATAKVLVALADALAPATKREARAT